MNWGGSTPQPRGNSNPEFNDFSNVWKPKIIRRNCWKKRSDHSSHLFSSYFIWT